jgi:hypothetical protein
MGFFKRLIDIFTLGSDRPLLRLVAYYTVLGLVVLLLCRLFPLVQQQLQGEHLKGVTKASQLLEDGVAGAKSAADSQSGLELALRAVITMLATLALMIPVSWVFMSARRTRDFSQSVVQTLIILPLVVAGIVLVVRTSLALAFSLGGIVAGLRFRTTLSDVRDTVYIFLGIGVGLAAGVQSLIVAAVLSVTFNFVVLLIWRYDFGRNVLDPTASSQWTEPLGELVAKANGAGNVPDRDLVLALTPKDASALAKRFERVQKIIGSTKHKPRFNAILSVTTDALAEAQAQLLLVLDKVAKRWRLDQVVTNEGKPSELYYLVGVKKKSNRDEFLTALRAGVGDTITKADLEIGDGAKGKHNGQ